MSTSKKKPTDRCTHEDPPKVVGDPAIRCDEPAAAGTALCDEHTWEQRKQRAEQRLSLARGAASEHEATNAAVAACAMVAEHKLGFFPQTPMLARAQAAYDQAAPGDARRAAALSLARASTGATLLRQSELDILLKAEEAAARQRAQTDTVDDAKRRLITIAKSWMDAGMSVAGAVFAGVETSDGKDILGGRGKSVLDGLRDVEQRLQSLRKAVEGTGVSPKRKSGPKRTKTATSPKRVGNARKAKKKPR